MKAKTIVGLMACAVLAPAFADTINNNNPTVEDWFSSGVASETILTSNASWGQSAPSLNTAKTAIEIDADVTSPATLTPTAEAVSTAGKESDGLVTITSKAYLAPSAKSDLPAADALGNAQVGFAVATETIGETATTSFYAYTKTANGGVWTRLSDVIPSAEVVDTDFKIELDYRSTPKVAKFYVKVGENYVQLSGTPDGGTSTDAFEFVPADSKLSDIAAIGSGTITSINAKYEKAVAVGKDGKAYGTIAEAYNTKGSYTVAVWDPKKGGVADDQNAENGLTLAECKALNIEPNATIALTPATHTAEKIVLQTAIAPVDGIGVTFAVGATAESATGSYPANAIEIPLTQGTYVVKPTVTAGN